MTTKYGDYEGFVAYWTERGNTTLAGGDEDDINASLLIASEWSDGNYRTMFPGWKTAGRAQDREWPREGAYVLDGPNLSGNPARVYFATDEIPVEQINAVYELAGRNITTPGILSVDYNASDAIKRASVEGAVSVEFVGASDAFSAQTVFSTVDALMAPLLVGDGAIGNNPLVGWKVRG